MISKYLDKENLHHAYLIEGAREEILPELLKSLQGLESELVQFSFDSLKMEDSRIIKSHALEKSMSGGKRIFIISANSILLDAQNSLLKLFEEPIENTHFFLIIPDANSLLKTLVSRFYVIRSKNGLVNETKDAEKFVAMSLPKRLEFIKEFLIESDEEENEIVVLDGTRSKAIKFLNSLELVLSRGILNTSSCEHIFKVREFLRMPGSSMKTLLESVALIIPVL
jgi:DNA polymerase III delta prime subunit